MYLSAKKNLSQICSFALAVILISPNQLLADVKPKNKTINVELKAAEFDLELIEGKKTPAWGYNGQVPGTELRCRQGDTLKIKFINNLPEQSTIHWHGMRVPLEMDGVPYVSQLPVLPGEYFNYEFKCQDAGNYWYHPHEGSTTQLGRGLFGPLIVEESTPSGFAVEQTLVFKTWHVDEEGQFTPFVINSQAALAGTKGRLHTINSKQNPAITYF